MTKELTIVVGWKPNGSNRKPQIKAKKSICEHRFMTKKPFEPSVFKWTITNFRLLRLPRVVQAVAAAAFMFAVFAATTGNSKGAPGPSSPGGNPPGGNQSNTNSPGGAQSQGASSASLGGTILAYQALKSLGETIADDVAHHVTIALQANAAPSPPPLQNKIHHRPPLRQHH